MKTMDQNEIELALKDLPGWILENGTITKAFTFTDFKEAFALMTRIAFECEAKNHHPNWENVYNSLTIKLSTHDANGITRKDIDLALTIEKIVR